MCGLLSAHHFTVASVLRLQWFQVPTPLTTQELIPTTVFTTHLLQIFACAHKGILRCLCHRLSLLPVSSICRLLVSAAEKHPRGPLCRGEPSVPLLLKLTILRTVGLPWFPHACKDIHHFLLNLAILGPLSSNAAPWDSETQMDSPDQFC